MRLTLPLLLSLLPAAAVIALVEQPYQWFSALGFVLQRRWPLGAAQPLPGVLVLAVPLLGTLLFLLLAWGPLARGRGGGLTGLLALQRPAEAGAGADPDPEATARASLSPMVQLARLPLLALTHLAGLSVGTESPSAALGASTLLALRRWLPPLAQLPLPLLLAIGGGAGLGAAFRSPILGLAYALEELSTNGGPLLVLPTLLLAGLGTILAGWIAPASLGQPARLVAPPGAALDTLVPPALWPALLLTAVVMGLLGVLFVRLLVPCSALLGSWLRRHRWRSAAALALAFALVAVLSGGFSLNDGSLALGPALAGNPTALPWAGLPRLLGPLLSISFGAPGGLMHDTMTLGAVVVGPFVQGLPPEQRAAFAGVAAAAVFAGACRTPLFCAVFVFTLQSQITLVPWLLVASSVAAGLGELCGGPTWNEAQVERQQAARRSAAPS
ncbi:MAG: chloride channel protein [Synechococcus sp.]|nr:chloride channel protein [Synechococcus sp.]